MLLVHAHRIVILLRPRLLSLGGASTRVSSGRGLPHGSVATSGRRGLQHGGVVTSGGRGLPHGGIADASDAIRIGPRVFVALRALTTPLDVAEEAAAFHDARDSVRGEWEELLPVRRVR